MPYFEVTGVGFDASPDKTDHRVLWVAAASRTELDVIISGYPVQDVSDLEDMVSVTSALDYTLPQDAVALRARLQEYASLEGRLVELLRDLLGQLASDMLEDHSEATLEAWSKANLFLTAHFPKD